MENSVSRREEDDGESLGKKSSDITFVFASRMLPQLKRSYFCSLVSRIEREEAVGEREREREGKRVHSLSLKQ